MRRSGFPYPWKGLYLNVFFRDVELWLLIQMIVSVRLLCVYISLVGGHRGLSVANVVEGGQGMTDTWAYKI